MSKTTVELLNFFIFNPTLSAKEGEEVKKILYYHPITDNVDVQIKHVGLVEAIVQFTSTFKPNTPANSLHTLKTRQVYLQAEPNFWIVMTLSLPKLTRDKDGSQQIDYIEDDVQDNVFGAVLEQAYLMYRLFWATFQQTIQQADVATLKTRLENFYKAYLKSLKLTHSDLLNVFCGIQYLPLDKLTFLKVQCFVNSLECTFPCVGQSAFLYNEHLIWSGIEPNDMKIIYQYLIRTLLPANLESELQGGSIPRTAASPFSIHHGRFIVGPVNLKTATGVGKIPKIYLYSSKTPQEYHLVVYRALSATLCLFIKPSFTLDLQFFKALDEYISPKMASLVSEISDYCTKQVITPSNIPEASPRFIYFNKLNLAYKSTVHLDNKQVGNLACPKESLQIMADLNGKRGELGYSSETIVKTMNDYWVVAKNSNMREFYVAIQQKNASLIDISEEVKKLCETELKGIFFHPI